MSYDVSFKLKVTLQAQEKNGSIMPNSTTVTRPDFVCDPVSDDVQQGSLWSPTSPRTLSGRRFVCSISTCTDFVRGSGLVWSRTKSAGLCSGI